MLNSPLAANQQILKSIHNVIHTLKSLLGNNGYFVCKASYSLFFTGIYSQIALYKDSEWLRSFEQVCEPPRLGEDCVKSCSHLYTLIISQPPYFQGLNWSSNNRLLVKYIRYNFLLQNHDLRQLSKLKVSIKILFHKIF